MKGICNVRPSLPKYTTTRTPDIVLHYFNSLPVNDNLTLKQLSYKLATLLCFMAGQRNETISKLSINHMAFNDDKCTIYVPIKNCETKLSSTTQLFLGFPKNEKLSLISTLNVYLK